MLFTKKKRIGLCTLGSVFRLHTTTSSTWDSTISHSAYRFFFFSFGLWWKHKDNLQIKHLSILYILLLLTYLSHIVSFGLVVLGMSVAAGCIWGGKALVEAWRVRTERIGTITRKFIVSLKLFFRSFSIWYRYILC